MLQTNSRNLLKMEYFSCSSYTLRSLSQSEKRQIFSGPLSILYEQLRGKPLRNYRKAVLPYSLISSPRYATIFSAYFRDRQDLRSRCKLQLRMTCSRKCEVVRNRLSDIYYRSNSPHLQVNSQPLNPNPNFRTFFAQTNTHLGCLIFLCKRLIDKRRESCNKAMIYEQQQVQRNAITIFINIQLQGVEREITFATHHNTARLFTIGSFLDNEHYTYLESLLIQTNPKEEDSVFEVNAIIPSIKSERKKVLEKLGEFSAKICEAKLGNGELQLPLTFLLKRPYNMYSKELESASMRRVLEKLLETISVDRDTSNRGQFDLKLVNPKASMMLDKSTINALQIFTKEMEKKTLSANATLYDILNQCKTSFGNRCLKRWMKQPLQSVNELQLRLDKIEFFITNPGVKNLIQTELKKLPDLDRLYFVFYKVAAGKKVRCQVSDLMKIYRVVESLSELVRNLQNKDLTDSIILQVQEQLKRNVEIISKISKMIEKGIDMSGSRDNEFYVRPETQASLEAIMKQMKQIQGQISHQVIKVAKHLDLQVEKTPSNTHKYVLQANKKLAINNVKQTPGYKFLTAKQTKITFTTDTLSRLCERLNIVEDEYKNQQQVLLRKMFELVAGYYPVMEDLSFLLSELDVLTTIATVVITSSGMWCRPRFGDSLVGKGMRHPCIKNCVPNDCELAEQKTVVLTGPNMGGKSTYIRTIGVCTYLAHIGCYVPAQEFLTPVVDAIITRVGASDLQVKGISTFMSEMLESSCMLETATSHSLVLIDELGRGTSTSEGFGIAWQICEYLHREVNPFCLFATHFHEMTRMADEVKGVKNMYTTCRVQAGQLMLQYKVESGKMKKSYGIEVMKILKFQQDVVDLAQQYLSYYESTEMEDQQISKYPQQVKEQAYRLIEELEDKISKTPTSEHERLRASYRGKFQAVLGHA